MKTTRTESIDLRRAMIAFVAVAMAASSAAADTDQNASAACGGFTVSYAFSREACSLLIAFAPGELRCVKAPGFDSKRCASGIRLRFQNQITGVVKKNDGTMQIWPCELNADGKFECAGLGQTCQNQDYLEAAGAKKPAKPEEEAEGATGESEDEAGGEDAFIPRFKWKTINLGWGIKFRIISLSDEPFSVTWPQTPFDGTFLLPGEEIEAIVELKNELVDAVLTTMTVEYKDGTVEEIPWVVTYVPGVPGPIGDLNGDGIVNVFDLLLLLEGWGPCKDCNDCPADLDESCDVNVFDLLLLLKNWG